MISTPPGALPAGVAARATSWIAMTRGGRVGGAVFAFSTGLGALFICSYARFWLLSRRGSGARVRQRIDVGTHEVDFGFRENAFPCRHHSLPASRDRLGDAGARS